MFQHSSLEDSKALPKGKITILCDPCSADQHDACKIRFTIYFQMPKSDPVYEMDPDPPVTSADVNCDCECQGRRDDV